MSEYEWIIDAMVEFSYSPKWNTPVYNFIDEFCGIFENGDEMKLEYTQVHKAFEEIADGTISAFVEDFGVSYEDVMAAFHIAIKKKDDPKYRPAYSFLKYLLYVQDFSSFHRMMVRRNLELDALASLGIDAGGMIAELNDNTGDFDAQLRTAIEVSLVDQNLVDKKIELEDAELQENLAESVAVEKERARQAEDAVEEEVEKKKAEDPAAAEMLREQELEKIRAEQEANIKKLEEETLKAREETMLKTLLATHTVDPTPIAAPVATPEPAAAQPTAQPAPETVAPAVSEPVPAAVPPPTAAAVPEVAPTPVPAPAAPEAPAPAETVPAVVPDPAPAAATPKPAPAPISSSEETVAVPAAPKVEPQPAAPPRAVSPEAPVPGASSIRNYRTLPTINPSFKELQQKVATRVVNAPAAQPNPGSPMSPRPGPAPTKEDFEARARYMREQREKILAMNKAKRDMALEKYSSGSAAAAAPKGDPNQQLTKDIARRVREDILREVRKGP